MWRMLQGAAGLGTAPPLCSGKTAELCLAIILFSTVFLIVQHKLLGCYRSGGSPDLGLQILLREALVNFMNRLSISHISNTQLLTQTSARQRAGAVERGWRRGAPGWSWCGVIRVHVVFSRLVVIYRLQLVGGRAGDWLEWEPIPAALPRHCSPLAHRLTAPGPAQQFSHNLPRTFPHNLSFLLTLYLSKLSGGWG